MYFSFDNCIVFSGALAQSTEEPPCQLLKKKIILQNYCVLQKFYFIVIFVIYFSNNFQQGPPTRKYISLFFLFSCLSCLEQFQLIVK